MYIFTQDKKLQDLFINGTRSGSMCLNDTIMQYAGKKFVPIGDGIWSERYFESMNLAWT